MSLIYSTLFSIVLLKLWFVIWCGAIGSEYIHYYATNKNQFSDRITRPENGNCQNCICPLDKVLTYNKNYRPWIMDGEAKSTKTPRQLLQKVHGRRHVVHYHDLQNNLQLKCRGHFYEALLRPEPCLDWSDHGHKVCKIDWDQLKALIIGQESQVALVVLNGSYGHIAVCSKVLVKVLHRATSVGT